VSGYIGKLLRVNYDDHRVKFPKDGESIDEGFMDNILTRKHTCWRYEKEWRLFSGRMDISPDERVDPSYIHLVDIPAEAVKEVIFGINTAAPTKTLIREIIKSDFPNATIAETRLHKTLFDLEIVELS
jgi:hypothetical protein